MRHLSLVAVVLIAMTACSSQSSSNGSSGSDQSSASSSSSSSTTAARSDSKAASSDSSGQIPEYPGATTEAAGSGSSMGQTASGKVLTTGDSFDKVYGWYQKNMPSGSEKSHTTSPMNTAVFMIGELGSGQKSVTITTQGPKTMITIADVKS